MRRTSLEDERWRLVAGAEITACAMEAMVCKRFAPKAHPPLAGILGAQALNNKVSYTV